MLMAINQEIYIMQAMKILIRASASIQGRLLEPMQSTHTVQESSRFVTKHDNFNPISTFNSNLKAGVINPLVRKSIKKLSKY